MDVINWVTSLNWGSIANIALQIIALCSMVSAITPNKVDDRAVQVLIDALNALGMNIGTSRNA